MPKAADFRLGVVDYSVLLSVWEIPEELGDLDPPTIVGSDRIGSRAPLSSSIRALFLSEFYGVLWQWNCCQ